MQLDTLSISGSYAGCEPLLLADATNNEVICAKGSVVQIMALNTGALINVFRGHKGVVTGVAVAGSSNSNVLIVSCSVDGHVIYWDKNTLQEVHHCVVDKPVYRMYIPSNSVQGKIFTENYRNNKSSGKRKTNGIESTGNGNNDTSNSKNEIYLVMENEKVAAEVVQSGAKGVDRAASSNVEREKSFKVVCYNLVTNKIVTNVSYIRRNIQNLAIVNINNEDYLLISSSGRYYYGR